MPPVVDPSAPDVLARQWSMAVEAVQEWLEIEPRPWALAHAKVLHAAGLTPAQGLDLYERLDPDVRGMLGRLVDAGRMASLDTANLHWWARAGLLRPEVTQDKRGRPRVAFTPWVTAARRYIAAVAGDERLAALAAAAGLTVQETADQFVAGTLNEESLRVLAAFADSGPLFALPVV